MVPLSNGQAILGGIFFIDGIMDQAEWNPNIYFLTCSNLECNIQTMTQTASFLATRFVAIPIPDDMSACIFRGKLIELTIKAVLSVLVLYNRKICIQSKAVGPGNKQEYTIEASLKLLKVVLNLST